MPIPFPPDGPQVKAALSKISEGVLQDYRKGTPPQVTGQVTPGPTGSAAEALNARGAMGAAGLRQKAMNNKVSNSTIFQQKDAELAQKAQQLQQQEQQLGVLGALMAKKAQDMQARESMGVANLPVRPDMFTAMDGGIVFSGGGGVQGYASEGLVNLPRLFKQSEDEFYGSPRNRAEANKVDLLRQIELLRPEEQAKLLESGTFGTEPDAFILRRRLQEMGYEVDPKTNRIKQLEEQGRRPISMQERRALDYIGKESSANPNEATVRLPFNQRETAPNTPSQPSKEPTVPPAPGIASLAGGASFKSRMSELDPYLKASVDRSESKRLTEELIASSKKVEAAVAAGLMTEEEGKRFIEDKKAEMAAEYAEYTKGRETRREKTRAALEGEAPTFQERLGKGLARLPTDLKGVRLGGLFGALGAGAAESDTEYTKRKREAAKYLAEAEELDAKADLAERRGQSKEAEAFRDKAEDRRLRRAQTNVSMLQAGQGGIKAALEQARAGETEEGRRLSSAAQAASGIASTLISSDTQRAVAEFQAENARRLAEYQVANREKNPYLQMVDMLSGTGMDKKEAIAFVLGKGKDNEGLPSGVMGKIAEDVIGKYANPHDPRVIAAVEKLDPNSAKILRLDPKDAMKQPGYAAALDIVERAKRQELLSSIGKSQSYTSLPAPPSK